MHIQIGLPHSRITQMATWSWSEFFSTVALFTTIELKDTPPKPSEHDLKIVPKSTRNLVTRYKAA